MATYIESSEEAERSVTVEKSAKKLGAVKRGAKKAAVKKSVVKKDSAKKVTATRTAKAASTKRAKSGASTRKQVVKVEEERAHYLVKIEANELRLHHGNASNEQPLTPEQIKTTQDILSRQREHLAELDSYVATKSDDPRT